MIKSPKIEELDDNESSTSATSSPVTQDNNAKNSDNCTETTSQPTTDSNVDDDRTTDSSVSPALSEEELESRLKQAEALKEEGNKHFNKAEYTQAIDLYTEAIDLVPEGHIASAVYYANRAACHLALKNYEAVVSDADKGLKLKPDYVKLLLRRAQANEALGHLEKAFEDYKKITQLDPSVASAKQAVATLPERIKIKQEKEKEEMIGQLKDIGNKLLGLVGLSLDNFKVEKDPNGGMRINFQK